MKWIIVSLKWWQREQLGEIQINWLFVSVGLQANPALSWDSAASCWWGGDWSRSHFLTTGKEIFKTHFFKLLSHINGSEPKLSELPSYLLLTLTAALPDKEPQVIVLEHSAALFAMHYTYKYTCCTALKLKQMEDIIETAFALKVCLWCL